MTEKKLTTPPFTIYTGGEKSDAKGDNSWFWGQVLEGKWKTEYLPEG